MGASVHHDPMENLKPGTPLTCIDDSEAAPELSVGKTYIVSEFIKGFWHDEVTLVGVEGSWQVRRFKLANQEDPEDVYRN